MPSLSTTHTQGICLKTNGCFHSIFTNIPEKILSKTLSGLYFCRLILNKQLSNRSEDKNDKWNQSLHRSNRELRLWERINTWELHSEFEITVIEVYNDDEII